MSAGQSAAPHEPQPSTDLSTLAPAFAEAVRAAIAECRTLDLDAMVYEAYRSNELQGLYYKRGRTVIPPRQKVTNASTNEFSWHGYGLAVDVISESAEWNKPDAWFAKVAEVFARHDCKWGGSWKSKDLPHFQWGRCKPSPSQEARTLLRTKGQEAVWAIVGANTKPTVPIALSPYNHVDIPSFSFPAALG
jgi:hypothetical protein